MYSIVYYYIYCIFQILMGYMDDQYFLILMGYMDDDQYFPILMGYIDDQIT